MSVLYRSEEGREAVLESYDRRAAALDVEVEVLDVPTCAGRTRILAAGPPEGPPIVSFHGVNGDAVAMVPLGATWVRTHRCYFVDVPGEPNRSHELPMARSVGAVAAWWNDLRRGLSVDRAAMFGISGGGGLALRAAAGMPATVSALAVVVPEALTIPEPGVFEEAVMTPLAQLRAHPTSETRRAYASAFWSGPLALPEAVSEQMGLVVEHVREPVRYGDPLPDGALDGYSSPALVVTGAHDIVFPGDRAAERARALLPHAEVLRIPEANHIDMRYFFGPLAMRIWKVLRAAR